MVKGLDIYIPPLDEQPVYNLKWHTDWQWHYVVQRKTASSGSPLPEWMDFGPRSLQL